MRKLLMLAIFQINVIFIFSGSLDYIQSGEYAFYKDERGSMNYLRGYWLLKVENGQYYVFSRNVNLDNGKEVNFYFALKDDKEGKLEVVEIKSLPQNASFEIQQAVPDFLNFVNLYLSNREKIEFETTIEDPWENYTLYFTFNPVLPFFRFMSIINNRSEGIKYKLESARTLKHNQGEYFFTYKGRKLEEKKRPQESYILSPEQEIQVDINGYTVILDKNWDYHETMGNPGYWLRGASYRESQISIEKIPEDFFIEKKLDPLELARLTILAVGEKVFYNSIKAEKKGDSITVFYALLDENNIRNYQYFSIMKRNSNYYVLNFSTFSDIFDSNEAYYKRILEPFMFFEGKSYR